MTSENEAARRRTLRVRERSDVCPTVR